MMKELVRRAGGFWEEFFFTPTSPATVGWVRIFFGILALAWGWLNLPDLEAYFGPYGMLSPETQSQVVPGPRIQLLALAPYSVTWLYVFFWFYMLGALFLTLGLLSRAASVVVFLGIVTFSHRNPFVLNSGDTLLRAIFFFMMFLPTGAAYSLDRLIAVARARKTLDHEVIVPWALRLIQIQLCICYLATALWKTGGSTWWDGTALYYAVNLYDFQRITIPHLFDSLWAIKLFTWSTLALEIALPLLLWVPRLRYPLIASAIAFHLGIELTMNIPLFEFVMIGALLSFVLPEDFSRVSHRFAIWVGDRFLGAKLKVYFDGECEFCRRSADVVRSLDVCGRFEWINFRKVSPSEVDHRRAEEEMLLRTSSGQWLGGFYAFRLMSWRMPLTMPIAPLLYLPGIAQAGPWAYRWVARNRFLFLGRACDPEGGACGIHRP
jgi:predicted DCC family thiol-disulfide oxidoreductase YuxK